VGCRLLLVASMPLAWLCLQGGALHAQPPAGAGGLLRFGMSAAMLGEMNRNDAKAALDVWGSTLAARRSIALRAEAHVLDDFDGLARALRAGQLDMVVLPTEEYFAVASGPLDENVFIGLRHGEKNEEFVVVTRRRANGVPALTDLEGASLLVLEGPRSSLGWPWLETLLAERGLGPGRGFFGSVTTVPKLSKAILPVFFKQQDACLVTRSGWQTMVEMNPQVGRELATVVTSPPLVPAVMFIRPEFAGAERRAVIDALLSIHTDPRGQQVLSLFGIDRVLPATDADLQPARHVFAAALARGRAKRTR
jgi:ABC-type phosphate/phosphonate transport system substrate-binding protein